MTYVLLGNSKKTTVPLSSDFDVLFFPLSEVSVQTSDPFGELCEQFKNQAFFSPSNSINSSLFTKVKFSF